MVKALHPLGQPITAEDCAEAALYLASDLAANVTGSRSRSTAGTSRVNVVTAG